MDQGKGEKRMKQDIHPNYQPVVFMDSTTGFKFLQVQLKGSSETVEWEECYFHYYVLRLLQTHTHSTLVVKIHTSRRTCGPFQQKYGLKDENANRRIVFQNIVMTRFIEVFHCGGKPLCWKSFKFREII